MDYQLKPLGKVCAECGKELVPGDVCYSAVVEKGNEWVRLDFSAEHWKGPPKGAIGYWKGKAPLRAETRRSALDPEALLRHFEQLCEEANPAHDKLRYVLALLLIRRRRLRLNRTHAEGDGSYLELSGLEGEGPFQVREQQINASEIEVLEQELQRHLTD